MTASDEIVCSLNKLHDTFNSFNQRLTCRTRTIEMLKQEIGFEHKMLKVRVMQKNLITEKQDAIQGLTKLLGSEMKHVEGLQRKIVDQHKSLVNLSELLRKTEQDHSKEMVSRKYQVERFKAEYNKMLKSAGSQIWAANQGEIMDAEKEKNHWIERLKTLKSEVDKRQNEYALQERQLEIDLLKKEQEIQRQGNQKIVALRKSRQSMERKFQEKLESMRVQTEGQQKRLHEEYEELCTTLTGNFGCGERLITGGSKSGKRKHDHPYLEDYKEDN